MQLCIIQLKAIISCSLKEDLNVASASLCAVYSATIENTFLTVSFGSNAELHHQFLLTCLITYAYEKK